MPWTETTRILFTVKKSTQNRVYRGLNSKTTGVGGEKTTGDRGIDKVIRMHLGLAPIVKVDTSKWEAVRQSPSLS